MGKKIESHQQKKMASQMSVPPAKALIDSWETARNKLLNTAICDLGVNIHSPAIAKYIFRLYQELQRKDLVFRPSFYLTDSWGCPNQVPTIGIPFYLADPRLARIEEEQTGEIEDAHTIMMLLRHECGHAFNYAYRLWEDPDWSEVFGLFTKRYVESFQPNPRSKHFVKHLDTYQYGLNYAQKHPDEDFAETFAVWLTPRSSWRRKYKDWPAIRKLKYVDRLMHQIRNKPPVCTEGVLLNPVEKINIRLIEHYGQKNEHVRETAQSYIDDRLREIFPPAKGRHRLFAHDLLQQQHDDLLTRMTQWSDLDRESARTLLEHIAARSHVLHVSFKPEHEQAKLLDVCAFCISCAVNYSYTGRLNG